MSATKRLRFTMVALMVACGLVIPASTTMAAPAAQAKTSPTHYAKDDHVKEPVYFFGELRSKYVSSTKHYTGAIEHIDVLANDSIGLNFSDYPLGGPHLKLSGAKRGFFGVKTWGTVIESAGGNVFYRPTSAGKDSFKYVVVSDVTGKKHSANVYLENVQLKEIVPTPLVNGLKLHNPNDTWLYVKISNKKGKTPSGVRHIFKLKAHSSYSFKLSAKNMKKYYPDGKISYSVSSDRDDSFVLNRIDYKVKALKATPKVPTKVKCPRPRLSYSAPANK